MTVNPTMDEIIGEALNRPQTNADRIRNMSDEELAEWLVSIIECDDGCPCIKECGEKEEMGFCYPSMIEWLRKEVDDG